MRRLLTDDWGGPEPPAHLEEAEGHAGQGEDVGQKEEHEVVAETQLPFAIKDLERCIGNTLEIYKEGPKGQLSTDYWSMAV